MARVTPKRKELATQTARQEDAEDAERSIARDATMARLSAARVCAKAMVDALDEALAYFIDTDEDDEGKERIALVEEALDLSGMATRALEAAAESIKAIDPEECEPWDEDSEED